MGCGLSAKDDTAAIGKPYGQQTATGINIQIKYLQGSLELLESLSARRCVRVPLLCHLGILFGMRTCAAPKATPAE